MKKEFILKEYTNKDILMHCSTKKEVEQFCEFLNNQGKKLDCGESYRSDNCLEDWDEEKGLYFIFNDGCYTDDVEFFKECGAEFLEFSDFEYDMQNIVDNQKRETEYRFYATDCETNEKLYKCSLCTSEIQVDENEHLNYKFCPYCGAKVRKIIEK